MKKFVLTFLQSYEVQEFCTTNSPIFPFLCILPKLVFLLLSLKKV